MGRIGKSDDTQEYGHTWLKTKLQKARLKLRDAEKAMIENPLDSDRIREVSILTHRVHCLQTRIDGYTAIQIAKSRCISLVPNQN